jgi:hypothetical protein
MAATIAHSASVNRSGNEGHGGPLQGGVQASTSGAVQRIKRRPSMNHIGFIGLKNFPERLLNLSIAHDPEPRATAQITIRRA